MVKKKDKSIYFILFILLLSQLMGPSVWAETYTYPKLNAESAVLMDAATGQILFEKNMHKRQYPASITKIMTGLLAIEKGNLADSITMSREAVFSIGRNSSHIALDVEEELTLEQALYAIAVASANDAANGIAEHISGSLESFARLMNERAIQCGAMDTNFVNAHGLPHENHYTTAYDMAKIMREAVRNPKFLEIFCEARYEMPPTNKQEEVRYLKSRNIIINGSYECEGIIAGKNGWTSQANHTLITAAKRNDRTLIVVVMNNQNLNNNHEDTVNLLNYGFEDFLDIKIDVADFKMIIGDLNLNNAEDVKVKPAHIVARLLHKNISVHEVEKSYEFLESNGDDSIRALMLLNLKEPSNFMYKDLGSILVEAEIINGNMSEAEKTAKKVNYFFPGDMGLLFLGLILAFVRRRSIRKRNKYIFRKPY